MNIHRPDEFDAVYRVTAIDADRSDDNNDRRRRRKVRYQGRSWSEKEEDLPLSPSGVESPLANKEKSHRPALYADSKHMQKAKALLAHLTTLEEKLAQLFFLKAEATYASVMQVELEKAVLQEQLGGIIFVKGDFKREAYLIEHLQEITKTPLLFGNDLSHGFSFYFQDRALPEMPTIKEKHASDLGKTIMAQNRTIGVHLQLDRDLAAGSASSKSLSQKARVAFRKGVRQAQGIVGRQLILEPKEVKRRKTLMNVTPKGPALAPPTPILSEQNIQEAVGLKTLDLVDLTETSHVEQELKAFFKHTHDAFIIRNQREKALAILANAVRAGDISESEIDKRVLKVLLIKTLLI